MSATFTEKQRFTQWWLWMILLPIATMPLYGIIQQVILGEPFGSKPMSTIGLLLFTLFVWGLVYLFWSMRLITMIDEKGISLHYIPLSKRSVTWEDVASAEIVTYGFVGYGIRFGSKHGIIYNVSGNRGLAIILKDGVKFLIGTQKEDELREYLEDHQKVQ